MASNRARASNKTASEIVSLAVLVAAGPDGMMVPVEQANALAAAGHAEIKPGSEAEGKVQTRASAAGIEAAKAAPQTDAASGAASGAASAPAAAKPSFSIEEGVPMPETGPRSGGRTEMYPFDALPAPRTEDDGKGGTRVVMASFFVPGKEPKSLASTVTGARNRYATEVPGQTRTGRGGKTFPVTTIVRDFKVLPDTKDGVKGSRIWRTK